MSQAVSDYPSLVALADRINTGRDNPDSSRALVVFNPTGTTLEGIAIFYAAMSWPRDMPLPPIQVTDMEGRAVPAAIYALTEGRDAKGRLDRHQISFALHFAVSGIPTNGWRTYLASYTEVSSPLLTESGPTPGLIVVETLRHGGDLPPTGTF